MNEILSIASIRERIFFDVKRINRVLQYDSLCDIKYRRDSDAFNYYSYIDIDSMINFGHFNLLNEKLNRGDHLDRLSMSLGTCIKLLDMNQIDLFLKLYKFNHSLFMKITSLDYVVTNNGTLSMFKMIESDLKEYNIHPTNQLLLTALTAGNGNGLEIASYLIDAYPNLKISSDVFTELCPNERRVNIIKPLVDILLERTDHRQYWYITQLLLCCPIEKIHRLCGRIKDYCLDHAIQCLVNIKERDYQEELVHVFMDNIRYIIVEVDHWCYPPSLSVDDIANLFGDVTSLKTKSLLMILHLLVITKYVDNGSDYLVGFIRYIIKSTAQHNNNIIQYLYQHLKLFLFGRINYRFFDLVCACGSSKQVEIIHQLMLDDNNPVVHKIAMATYEAMDGASKQGSLDIVRFLHLNRDEQCSKGAIKNHNHSNTIWYILENKSGLIKKYSIQEALSTCNLNFFKWFYPRKILIQEDSDSYDKIRIEYVDMILVNLEPKSLIIYRETISRFFNKLNSQQIIEFIDYLIPLLTTSPQSQPELYYHLFSETCQRGDMIVFKYLDQLHPLPIITPDRFKTTILDDAFLNGCNQQLVQFIINNRKERFGKESWISVGCRGGKIEFNLINQHSEKSYLEDCIINAIRKGNIKLVEYLSEINSFDQHIRRHLTVFNCRKDIRSFEYYLKNTDSTNITNNIQSIVSHSLRHPSNFYQTISMIESTLIQSRYTLSFGDVYYILQYEYYTILLFIFQHPSLFIHNHQHFQLIPLILTFSKDEIDFIQQYMKIKIKYNTDASEDDDDSDDDEDDDRPTIISFIKTQNNIDNDSNKNSDNNNNSQTTVINQVFKNRYLFRMILAKTTIKNNRTQDKLNIDWIARHCSRSWIKYILSIDSLNINTPNRIPYKVQIDIELFGLILQRFPNIINSVYELNNMDNHNVIDLVTKLSPNIEITSPFHQQYAMYYNHIKDKDDIPNVWAKTKLSKDKYKKGYNSSSKKEIELRLNQESFETCIRKCCSVAHIKKCHLNGTDLVINKEMLKNMSVHTYKYLRHNRSNVEYPIEKTFMNSILNDQWIEFDSSFYQYVTNQRMFDDLLLCGGVPFDSTLLDNMEIEMGSDWFFRFIVLGCSDEQMMQKKDAYEEDLIKVNHLIQQQLEYQ